MPCSVCGEIAMVVCGGVSLSDSRSKVIEPDSSNAAKLHVALFAYGGAAIAQLCPVEVTCVVRVPEFENQYLF
jgi:hypothetical protein